MTFATLPAPPYYVVTFSSQRTQEEWGYNDMSTRMIELAAKQPGYLGVESVRGADGFGITNSFWENEDAIRNWKRVVDHMAAQKAGRDMWYDHYEVRIARVERAYGRRK
ncbi:hypothetical protein AEAC466_15050 [Asticcacaulis sp. AC466]|uniref:antibiotic biosynthesis monooxygenase family protein n=1 Tax=Asticcacaulis sp. AC466 TaxID=1282362 RepID=UPI0003C40012|nr:antibiotic biosynthesis monooxygenase [Asticcacaulis sp. AC466]ESQ82826.1 hypothetical protein AEAC466_15050 [Asticcacaulis sp. AC466]